MTDDPNVLNVLLARGAESLRSQWRDLVAIATRLAKDNDSVSQVAAKLAVAASGTEDSIKRKVLAIQYMQSLGYSEEEICQLGQTVVLSEFGKSKRVEKYEKLTTLSWRIPGSQRESAQIELARVMRVLNLKTSEELWDWIIGQIRTVSDEELLHSAGEKK